MKMRYWIFPLVVMASGCAVTPSSVSSNPTAQKSTGAICATVGASLSAMVVAGATGALQKIKPEAETLYPVCSAKTPSSALTVAQAKAYTALINAAAPYLGD